MKTSARIRSFYNYDGFVQPEWILCVDEKFRTYCTIVKYFVTNTVHAQPCMASNITFFFISIISLVGFRIVWYSLNPCFFRKTVQCTARKRTEVGKINFKILMIVIQQSNLLRRHLLLCVPGNVKPDSSLHVLEFGPSRVNLTGQERVTVSPGL